MLPPLASHTLSPTASSDMSVTGQQKDDMMLPPLESHSSLPTTRANIGVSAEQKDDLVFLPLASNTLSPTVYPKMGVTGQQNDNMMLPQLASHSSSPTSSSGNSEVCAVILMGRLCALIGIHVMYPLSQNVNVWFLFPNRMYLKEAEVVT